MVETDKPKKAILSVYSIQALVDAVEILISEDNLARLLEALKMAELQVKSDNAGITVIRQEPQRHW